jgi:DNA-binding MarR family transcriptional regulator
MLVSINMFAISFVEIMTIGRPTMPRLDDQLCFSIYTTGMAIARVYKPLLDELKLTYPQYLVLNALWEGNSRTIGAIADRLALDSSTVTPLVKRLEAAGFVVRQRSTTDERQVLVTLTPKGSATESKAACLGETFAKSSEMTMKQLSGLNEQVKALREAFDRSTRGRG